MLRFSVAQEKLDEYAVIQLVNYIRSQVAAGADPLPALAASTSDSAATGSRPRPWQDERYLRPVLPDDALLFFDVREAVEGEDFAPAALPAAQQALAPSGGASAPDASSSSQAVALAQLQRENEMLKTALQQMQAACMPQELLEDDVAMAEAAVGALTLSPAAAAAASGSGAASTSASAHDAVAAAPSSRSGAAAVGPGGSLVAAGGGRGKGSSHQRAASSAAAARAIDDAYFDSYSGFGIHREMLSDKPRTEAYRDAFAKNPELARGKVVLDVGCGTAILSMFAARGGGAARVVGVDGSKDIAGFASRIVEANGLGGAVTVVCGKVEELAALPSGVDKVDIIVSEWMGYALLFETMLDTVLHARDRFLKPGGAVLPDIASISIAGGSAGATGLNFWADVYGFDMAPVAESIRSASLRKALVLDVPAGALVTAAQTVHSMDLCTMAPNDQDFSADFSLDASPSLTSPAACHAVVLWFDVHFSERFCTAQPVVLSTAPAAPLTHWAQTVLLLKAPVLLCPSAVAAAAGSLPSAPALTGRVSMSRSRVKHRSLDISLEYQAALSDGSVVKETMLYSMSVND